jgi:predicted nucleic acid-binding protein
MDALVDTSILIDIYRRFSPAMSWLQANSGLILGITSVVWMEVLLGAQDKHAQQQLARFLANFSPVYLTQADQQWAMRKLQAYRLRDNVGINDCLIAAPCERLQLPLYTRNLKHFTPLLGTLTRQPY